MQPRVPDNYVPDIYNRIAGYAGQATAATAGWPTNNKALYVPVIFPYPCTLTSIAFQAGNGTGNYDLGFYDGYSKLKFQTSGSTAMTAAGTKTLTFTAAMRVDAGRLYYAALALSSTSGSVLSRATVLRYLIANGMGEQTTSLPLPSTAAPVTLTASYAPVFIFGVR